MRIDAYTQVQQLYGNKKTQKVTKTTKTAFKDQLQISSMGRDIQVAKQAVGSVADVREEVIAPLKKAVNAGTYEVKPEQFAEKLIQKYKMTQTGSF